MHCPKCGSSESVKNGIIREKQRYKCKSCGCNYTQSVKHGYPLSMRIDALRLMREGLGFRGIGRFLGVSDVTVMRWMRDFGEDLAVWYDAQRYAVTDKDIPIVEIDEMWHFCQKNSINSGFGLLFAVPQDASLPSKVALVAPKR